VPRDRILQQLDQGLTGRLILVSAAVGFGKTTVLSDWAQHRQLPVSWLALDERDNDPTRFWTYIVAALQRTDAAIGEATLAMLQSPEPLDFEVFLTPLLNELAQAQTDLIVVLDDYHLITTPAIHDALTFLLEHLPSRIHLAIATRSDPPLPWFFPVSWQFKKCQCINRQIGGENCYGPWVWCSKTAPLAAAQDTDPSTQN